MVRDEAASDGEAEMPAEESRARWGRRSPSRGFRYVVEFLARFWPISRTPDDILAAEERRIEDG